MPEAIAMPERAGALRCAFPLGAGTRPPERDRGDASLGRGRPCRTSRLARLAGRWPLDGGACVWAGRDAATERGSVCRNRAVWQRGGRIPARRIRWRQTAEGRAVARPLAGRGARSGDGVAAMPLVGGMLSGWLPSLEGGGLLPLDGFLWREGTRFETRHAVWGRGARLAGSPLPEMPRGFARREGMAVIVGEEQSFPVGRGRGLAGRSRAFSLPTGIRGDQGGEPNSNPTGKSQSPRRSGGGADFPSDGNSHGGGRSGGAGSNSRRTGKGALSVLAWTIRGEGRSARAPMHARTRVSAGEGISYRLFAVRARTRVRTRLHAPISYRVRITLFEVGRAGQRSCRKKYFVFFAVGPFTLAKTAP